MPAWPNRSSSAADQCGSTVEHMTKVLPGFMAAAAPPAPNSPDSVCAPSTTTLTTTPQAPPTSPPPFPPPPPPGRGGVGGVVGGPPRPGGEGPPPRPAADRTHALHSRWHAASVRCLHPWRPSRRFLLFSWGWLPFRTRFHKTRSLTPSTFHI